MLGLFLSVSVFKYFGMCHNSHNYILYCGCLIVLLLMQVIQYMQKKKSSYQIQNIKLNIPSSSSVKTKQKEKGINKERSQKLNSLH